MPISPKVLFIGLDAADKDLILSWAEEGLLPNLRKLLAKSSWGITHNPIGLYVGAIWPSFYTSVSPATHGRYCYKQLKLGSYETDFIYPRDVKAPPFWEALSEAGKRIAVIDVPKTYPSELKNGLHIVDWGTHDPDLTGFTMCPETMTENINNNFPPDSMHNCNAFRTTAQEYLEFRDRLLERVNRKVELDIHCLEQGGWDCFLTVFSEAHCIGHQCWHLHDKKHKNYDPVIASVVGDSVKDVYQAVDKAIGQLVAKVDTDTQLILFASHGMGPHYDATFMLDDILKRLETGNSPSQLKPKLAKIITPLWKLLPHALRKKARPIRKKARVHLGIEKAPPSPDQLARRKYFSVPNNDAYGGVRINLIGREPNGLISAGSEYDALCATLSEELMEFINVETGEPLVKRVLRSDEFHQGKHADLLPDLMIEWNRSSPISSVSSKKTGTIKGEYTKCRTGDHKSQGLFLASGPSISPGKIDDPLSVMDIAPTIASLLGVTLANVEGKPISRILGTE